MKHINIPVFVPHVGCPHDCVFCNQKKITGKQHFDITSVEEEIRSALSTVDHSNSYVEIAFFGGSFTGIPESEMLALLEISDKFVDAGLVTSVRCSTRPDYIDTEILAILREHHVKTIEIGVQSIDDNVLSSSMRGHTSAQTVYACNLIVSSGFELVGQMMLGLPHSSAEAEIRTAEAICKCGASGARIYPTVVFEDTALLDLTKQKIYTPLCVEEAVKRAAGVIDVFVQNKVDIIRIGLCESEGLHKNGIYAGAFHPAIGEMCISEYYYLKITELLNQAGITTNSRKSVDVLVDRSSLSKAIGQNKSNKTRLASEYPYCSFRFRTDNDLRSYEIKIEIRKQS